MSDAASERLPNMFLITIEEGKPRVQMRPSFQSIPVVDDLDRRAIPVAGSVNERGVIVPFPTDKT